MKEICFYIFVGLDYFMKCEKVLQRLKHSGQTSAMWYLNKNAFACLNLSYYGNYFNAVMELDLALFSDNSCCWLLENQGMIASGTINVVA